MMMTGDSVQYGLAKDRRLRASGFTLVSQLACGWITRVMISAGFIITLTTMNLFHLTTLKKIII